MRHLGERPCCHDLGLPDKELALGLDVKVSCVKAGHERDQDPDLRRVERRRVMPPAFVSRGQLSELLGLLRPLDPSTLITREIVWIKVGPLMWETVSQVAGTDVRAHFRSMRLLASR